MRYKLLLVVMLAISGCTGDVKQFRDDPNGQSEYPEQSGPAWPGQPETARIRYLYSFSGGNQLGFKRPFLERIRDSLSGSDEQEFVRPYSISVNDRLFVIADPGAGVVYLLDKKKKSYRTIVRVNETSLVSPVGVAVSEDRIFIADSFLNTLFVLNRNLDVIHTVVGLQRPTALAWDSKYSRLYVAETHAHRIQVYDKDGNYRRTIGERGNGPAQFNFPTHLAIREGVVYVNDTMNFRVQLFSPEGSFINAFGEHGDAPGFFAQPKGVAVDSQGHIYVAESLAGSIQIFNHDGQFLMDFGEHGSAPGGFVLPAGLAMFQDQLYVCDSHNGSIQVFQYVRDE